jgi:hypothetical protein
VPTFPRENPLSSKFKSRHSGVAVETSNDSIHNQTARVVQVRRSVFQSEVAKLFDHFKQVNNLMRKAEIMAALVLAPIGCRDGGLASPLSTPVTTGTIINCLWKCVKDVDCEYRSMSVTQGATQTLR